MTAEPAASTRPQVLTSSSLMPALYEEQQHGDYQAREAVFVTFNADLGFFERTVLGVAQATGARVTVIADADVWNPDPRAARNAGTRYLPAVAVHRGAFHPKVNVVAGPSRGLISIGSGNLSAGGWHLNDELWTIARIGADGCPDFAIDIATWLRTLPNVVHMSEDATSALLRASAELDSLTAAVPTVRTGHSLVHTLSEPILDQLPSGPVERLNLYAPFHDPGCAAVRALIERYTPKTVRVGVQADAQTSVDPAALSDVLRWASQRLNAATEVVQLEGGRYRHGKLIEAGLADGRRWSLTGSANLSRAALLLPAAHGGNIEVALLTWDPPSLFPSGQPVEATAVHARPPAPPQHNSTQHGEPVLLCAVRTVDGTVRVDFATPIGTPCRIQVSGGFVYDVWRDAAQVSSGSDHVTLAADLRGGTRVRCAWTGPQGDPYFGPPHFVVDPSRIKQRAADSVTSARRNWSDPADIFADPKLADMWLTGLSQLAAAKSQVALPAGTGSGAPKGEDGYSRTTEHHTLDDEHSWLTYQDDAKTRLGPKMYGFALGGLAAAHSLERAAADLALELPTDIIVSESVAGLEDDDADTVVDDNGGVGSTAEPTADAVQDTQPDRSDPESQIQAARTARDRAKIRTSLTRAIREQAPHLAAVDRAAAVLLTYVGVHVGLWPEAHGEHGWAPVVADAVGVLEHRTTDGVSDIPERIAPNLGSLAAVGLFMLHDALQDPNHPGEAERYWQAVHAVSHLLPAASAAHIAEYVAPMKNINGFPIDPDGVISVAATALNPAPLAALVDLITTSSPDKDAHAHSPSEIHVIDEHASNPMLVAAQALELLANHTSGPHAALGTDRKGHRCLLVRDGADLVAVVDTAHQHRVHQFRLSALVTPVAIARDQETQARARVHPSPARPDVPEAEALLARVGIRLDAEVLDRCQHAERPTPRG